MSAHWDSSSRRPVSIARLRLRTRHRVIRVAHRRAVHYVRAIRRFATPSAPAWSCGSAVSIRGSLLFRCRPIRRARLWPLLQAGLIQRVCGLCCPTAGGCLPRVCSSQSLDFTTTSALPFVSSRFLCFCPCSVCPCLGTL